MGSYTIQRGDCLSVLAQRHNTSVDSLMKANPQIKDKNLIYAGAKLNIPGAKDDFSGPSGHSGTPGTAGSHSPSAPTGSSAPVNDQPPASGSAVEKMLSVARSNLGYHEGAGNANKFSAAMGRPGEAWCADFVSYVAKQAGLNTVNTASAQGIADQLAAKGRWKGKSDPQPGDAVTFNWDGTGGWADHVGIVESVYQKNGKTYINTIEGNSSDAVSRRTYAADAAVINGYGRIA